MRDDICVWFARHLILNECPVPTLVLQKAWSPLQACPNHEISSASLSCLAWYSAVHGRIIVPRLLMSCLYCLSCGFRCPGCLWNLGKREKSNTNLGKTWEFCTQYTKYVTSAKRKCKQSCFIPFHWTAVAPQKTQNIDRFVA